MKKIILLLIVIFCVGSISAQKVFSVNNQAYADVKVFVVNNQAYADLNVFKVNNQAYAGKNNGSGFL